MRFVHRRHIVACAVLMLVFLPSLRLRADISIFHLDGAVMAGLGYYVGDATSGIFQDVQMAAGAQLRYKFDQRWSLQVKGLWQPIAYSVDNQYYHNPVWNIDMTAEFNFFRFGMHPYDQRVKTISPFIFIGVGTSLCKRVASLKSEPMEVRDGYNIPNMYIPLGIGVKWKFAERWQLQASWQHQVYVCNGDYLEGLDNPNGIDLNDSYELNGINIMNNDLLSSLTVGIVYEFWKKGEICVHCEY